MKKEITKTMRGLITLIIGIVISLTFEFSTHFPTVNEEIPLATVDHIPHGGISMLLENLRRSMTGGYGLCISILALMIAFFLYKYWNSILSNAYISNPSFLLLSIVFGMCNTLGLCMFWMDDIPLLNSFNGFFCFVFLTFGWGLAFFCFCHSFWIP